MTKKCSIRIQKKRNNNKKGKYVCINCHERFKKPELLNAHRRIRCGITFKKYYDEINKRNEKRREKKRQIIENTKKYMEYGNFEKNDAIKIVDNYAWVKEYRFVLKPMHYDANEVILYGSKNNKSYLLKIFDKYVNLERKISVYKKISSLKLDESSFPFPTLCFRDKNIFIETYEGPNLDEIFNFCEKNQLKKADQITLCNIALDLLATFKILNQIEVFYKCIKLDSLTWNYKKNKIIFIDFYYNPNNTKKYVCKGVFGSTEEMEFLESFLYALIKIYDDKYWNGVKYLSDLYSAADNPNIPKIIFNDFENFYEFMDNILSVAKQLELNKSYTEMINDMYDFFKKKKIELTKNKDVGYRFIWEKYFKEIYQDIKSEKISKNILNNAFKKPFCLKKYINEIKS